MDHLIQLELPEDDFESILVVAGSPETVEHDLLRDLCRESAYTIAVDRGLDSLHEIATVPDLLVGDADSLSAESYSWFKSSHIDEKRAPRLKDDTDLNLAFQAADNHGQEADCAIRVMLTNASGGRPDHTLAVYGTLMRHAYLMPMLVDDTFECAILSPDGAQACSFAPQMLGHTVSLLPLSSLAEVSEVGMRWNLAHHTLKTLADRGVSNIIEEATARIECHKGAVAVFAHRFI